MNLRFVASAAFLKSVAWPVVPEPAKKSRDHVQNSVWAADINEFLPPDETADL